MTIDLVNEIQMNKHVAPSQSVIEETTSILIALGYNAEIAPLMLDSAITYDQWLHSDRSLKEAKVFDYVSRNTVLKPESALKRLCMNSEIYEGNQLVSNISQEMIVAIKEQRLESSHSWALRALLRLCLICPYLTHTTNSPLTLNLNKYFENGNYMDTPLTYTAYESTMLTAILLGLDRVYELKLNYPEIRWDDTLIEIKWENKPSPHCGHIGFQWYLKRPGNVDIAKLFLQRSDDFALRWLGPEGTILRMMILRIFNFISNEHTIHIFEVLIWMCAEENQIIRNDGSVVPVTWCNPDNNQLKENAKTFFLTNETIFTPNEFNKRRKELVASAYNTVSAATQRVFNYPSHLLAILDNVIPSFPRPLLTLVIGFVLHPSERCG